ncbi:NifU family protein [Robertmurraya massiliosenegalensis]|uniref:NifU family protein n=1 Tax=Robertmurraya massiliosenegalensis TaxID=1287657 RepID=UPI0002DB5E93|nr:NifU family protein [Robertmurraya massiliosenegalensis]
MKEEILEALEMFRKTLQADGADLQVRNVDSENITMELVIQDETCLDCIVSKSIMSNIIESQLKKKGIPFENLNLEYPNIEV